MTSFVTGNLPLGDPFRHLENPNSPWEHSAALSKRTPNYPKAVGNSYQMIPVLPTDPEGKMVIDAFEYQRPKGLFVKKVFLIEHGDHNDFFKLNLTDLERKEIKFPPSWPKTDSPSATKERKMVMERWEKLASRRIKVGQTDLNHIKVLPLWHATADKLISSICEHGFVVKGRHDVKKDIQANVVTDAGYYGAGAYFSDSAAYAHEVYGKDKDTGQISEQIILSLVLTSTPFPVIPEDYDPDNKKNLLLGINHGWGHHCGHFAPVNAPKYWPAPPLKGPPTCDEIVVFERHQAIPFFVIHLGKDASLSLVQPTNKGHFADLLMMIFQSSLKDNESIAIKAAHLLTEKEDEKLSDDDLFFYKMMKIALQGNGNLDSTDALLGLKALTNLHSPLLPQAEKTKDIWQKFKLVGGAVAGIITLELVCYVAFKFFSACVDSSIKPIRPPFREPSLPLQQDPQLPLPQDPQLPLPERPKLPLPLGPKLKILFDPYGERS